MEFIRKNISIKYSLILILSYFVKVAYFSFSTGMPIGKAPYMIVTVSVFFMLFILMHRSKKLYLITSVMMTLVMLGDLLYFRYFKDFLSVKLVNQATFVGSVTSIVFSILKFSDLIIWIDLIAYLIISKSRKELEMFSHKLSFVVMLIALPTVILSISFSSIYTGIKKYEFFNYHVYDIISLDTENSNLTSQDRQLILEEVKNRKSSKEYFGVAKEKKHVIVVQIESLQNNMINQFYRGQEITPNINRIIKNDSIYFTNYYQQLGKGNTSDAEFTSLNSLYPITSGNTYNVYENNTFYGLPWIMREHGYKTNSYHGYVANFWNRVHIYPQIGFEKSYFEHDYVMGEKIVFGLDDHDFFEQSIPFIANEGEKTLHFMVTLSSHKPFDLPEDKKWIELAPEDDNFFGHYLQSIHYMDHAFGQFIEDLKTSGIYDDAVIIFYGDHFGIGMEDEEAIERMEAFTGIPYVHEDMLNVPLVVHVPGSEIEKTVQITGGQIDFLPTVLNVLGIRNDYITFGRDLLNSDSGFVASQTFLEKGSFIDDTKVFVMSRDGVFENSTAYHRDTHEPIEIDACREGYERAIQQINLSKKITETDAIKSLLDELKSMSNMYEIE